ncbi:MAG: M48 family metallopeptidase [Prevotella sp.]|nr:M48 family metallopeptidase [Prevotella sp.]
MKRIKICLMALVVALVAASCGTSRVVPITGRTQNLMVSDAEILSLSSQEYTKYMQAAKKSTNSANTAMVQRVGQRLASAVETYLKEKGYQSELSQYQWEFNLVQDQNVNAFCMPGGKIVVYEGLLPVTQDEASLAIVLGHEIAHAVAKHSAEQMSKQIKQQYGTQLLGGVMQAAGVGDGVTGLAQSVIQSGFKFRNLKYSRDHETEADHMGLIFAAMAGYDPHVAVTFWQRMAAASGGGNQSDIFSDHPSDAKRIAAIQNDLPEALTYYKPVASTSQSASSSKKSSTAKKKTSSATKSSSSKKSGTGFTLTPVKK